MRFCSYTLTYDTGLAPNPFWGYCTLTVCTPNHMGIKAKVGDWFLGNTATKLGDKIIYAMQVSEVLPFEAYDADPRFEAKKPIMKASWQKRCGDNLYYRDEQGAWQQRPNPYHATPEKMAQDLKHPTAFISKHFYYFGENAIVMPPDFLDLLQRRQGCKCNHSPQLVKAFVIWLEQNYDMGVHGEPRDSPKMQGRSKNLP
ncbi:MAG: hypothetical protein H6668_20650 [Ardenticatenaceae bacterium]|nr:hypothetical protein [Ardenticatenaceae bacterium]